MKKFFFDVNEEAQEHEYFQLGALNVSPDNKIGCLCDRYSK